MIDIEELLAKNNGLILARDHPELKSSLSRWARQGKLARLMRGVYAHPDQRPEDRVRAVAARMPGAVIAGETAVQLVFHPEQPLGTVQVCTPTRRLPQPGYQFTRRLVPSEHARKGVMSPLLAAVDLADRDPGWLDELVRQHLALPNHFYDVLAEFPHRLGNPARRQRIARTSTRPWSVAERAYHDLLDTAGITGWVANETVRVGGVAYVLDIAFKAERLAIEIDGFAFHSGRAAFEADRIRGNHLAAWGWTVLHFTWDMLDDPDQIIRTIESVRSRLARARPGCARSGRSAG